MRDAHCQDRARGEKVLTQERIKLLVYDLGGCEGCPLSILRGLPQLSRIADVHSKHLGNLEFENKEYDVAVVTGSVCMNDKKRIEELKEIREKTRILVAYGSCAAFGGITLFCRGGQEPRPDHRTYQAVSKIVEVDYSIPGCPPAPATILSLLNCLKAGKGYVLQVFAALAGTSKLSGFDLIDEVVLPGLCVGCGACVLSCPTHALQLLDRNPQLIVERCIRCGTCCARCPKFTQLLVRRVSSKPKLLGE